MAHGFTTTQPPLARRLARFARHILLKPTTGLTAVPQPARRRPRIRPSPRPQHIPILAPWSSRLCLGRHCQPAFEAHPARSALSTTHSAESDSACLPASPVTLPTEPQPARTAPPVVESLSFLHRAPSPDARRVLARRGRTLGFTKNERLPHDIWSD